MTDTEEAIDEFLHRADAVFDEYDQGYTDADAALRQLRSHVDDLADASN